jgi:hypothetical protein
MPRLVKSRVAALAAAIAFLAAASLAVALHMAGHDSAAMLRIVILLGIPAWFAVAGALSRGAAAPLLRRSHGFAMFLFCSFDLILIATRRVFRVLRTPTDSMCLGMALGTFLASLAIYLLLRFTAHPLLRLLTGDRR